MFCKNLRNGSYNLYEILDLSWYISKGSIKKYWLLKIINFQCILHISTVLLLQSLQRWIITEWLWNFFETRYQNGPTSGIIWHMSHLIDYFLAWEISEYIILFIIEDPVGRSRQSCHVHNHYACAHDLVPQCQGEKKSLNQEEERNVLFYNHQFVCRV